MEQIVEYIKPELLILIPVLYLIGEGIKKTEKIDNKMIPATLGAVGMILCLLWCCLSCEIPTITAMLGCFFTAITQGVLVAGCSVYVNQLIKQSKKEE